MIAPSEWAKMGLVNSGAEPSIVKVVSHGVDVKKYREIKGVERVRLRAAAKWDSRWVGGKTRTVHASAPPSNQLHFMLEGRFTQY